MSVGQPVHVVVSRSVTWGYAVRVFFLVRGDPAHQRALDALGLERIPVSGPEVGVPGSWADPAAVPDAPRFVHNALAVGEDLQVPPEHLQGNKDGVELGSVHSLDWTGQGPGCRVRLLAPRPEPGGPLMTKMWLKSRGEINHVFVINFLGNFSSIDAVETPRMPMP